MFNKKYTSSKQHRHRGQALVETALFLPIFLVILAGVVEVSQYVITNNRLTSAARASTRFASNGGEDAGMVSIFKNAITNTMNVDEGSWDVFAIRGTLNTDGDDFSDWEFTHIYGLSQTQTITPLGQLDEGAIQQQILQDLQFDEDGNPITDLVNELAELRIVGTYIIYDMESLLNLDATPALSPIYSVTELNVMRISGLNVEASDGCSAFPIALGLGGIRSLTQAGTGSNPFPGSGDFDYPLVAPFYEQFVRHQPNIGLDDNTPEGTVFKYTLGQSNANFSWLTWNQMIPLGPDALANSLKWPGNSLDYTNHSDTGNNHPDYGYVVRGYAEPGNATNTDLRIDSKVAQATGVQLSGDITFGVVNQSVNENIARERDLRLILFNSVETTTSSFIVERFGIFKLRGYGDVGTANEWLLVEFIRWDDTCGQLIESP